MSQQKRPNIEIVTYTIDKNSRNKFEALFKKLNTYAVKQGMSTTKKGVLLGRLIDIASKTIDPKEYFDTTL